MKIRLIFVLSINQINKYTMKKSTQTALLIVFILLLITLADNL